MEEQRLLQGSSDVGVGGNALEVGGRKLGKLVLGQILLFFLRQRRRFVEHLLSLLTLRGFLQVLQVKTRQADQNTTNKGLIKCAIGIFQQLLLVISEVSEIGSSLTDRKDRKYLKSSRSLSVLVGQRSRVPQEAEHAVHHVRVVHGLLLLPLHLLQQLLLPAGLLLLLALPLLLLLGQLDQPLLVLPLSLRLGPPRRHLVPQLLLLGEALALSLLAVLQLQVKVHRQGAALISVDSVRFRD